MSDETDETTPGPGGESGDHSGGGLKVIGGSGPAPGDEDRPFLERQSLEAERPISTPEFLRAVLEDEREEVAKMIVEDDRLVKSRDASGATAVLLAVYHGLDEMAGILLRSDVPLDVFEAAATGGTERVRELAGEDPSRLDPSSDDGRSGDGFTALHLACYFGHDEAVEAILDLAPSAHLPSLLRAEAHNPSRVLPLHSACACRDAEAALAIVRRLLAVVSEAGVAAELVAAEQAGGFRPLHQAASAGRDALVDLLLEHGADPAAEADLGQTAASLAEEKGHGELARHLAAL